MTKLITKITTRSVALEEPEPQPRDPHLELVSILADVLNQMPLPAAPGPAAVPPPPRRRDLREIAGLVWRSTLAPQLVAMGPKHRREVIVDARALGVAADAALLRELLQAFGRAAGADVSFWRRSRCARLRFQVAAERPPEPARIGSPRPGGRLGLAPRAPWFSLA